MEIEYLQKVYKDSSYGYMIDFYFDIHGEITEILNKIPNIPLLITACIGATKTGAILVISYRLVNHPFLRLVKGRKSLDWLRKQPGYFVIHVWEKEKIYTGDCYKGKIDIDTLVVLLTVTQKGWI